MAKINKLNIISLSVCVKPNSKRQCIELSGLTGVVTVRVSAPPVDQKANARVVELLADALDVPKSAVAILRGFGSKLKSIDVQTSLTFEQAIELLSCYKPKH